MTLVGERAPRFELPDTEGRVRQLEPDVATVVVFDYAARFGEATAALAGWLGEGRLISREHIVEGGVSAFPDALLKLFSGENMGKLVLSLGAE